MAENLINQKEAEINRQGKDSDISEKSSGNYDSSRWNSLRHGLTSELLCVFDSNFDFDGLVQELKDEFSVSSLGGEMLARMAVKNYIQAWRGLKIEKNIIDSSLNPPELQRVYKDKEAGEKFKQNYKIYENKLKEWEKKAYSVDFIPYKSEPKPEKPIEPEFDLVYSEGETKSIFKGQLEEIDLVNRYSTSAENRFFRSLKALREYSKEDDVKYENLE